MKRELNDSEVENVSGGRYDLRNNNNLYFETISGTFHVKANHRADAIYEMEKFYNVFATEAEYDQACLDKLTELGYLE